MRRNHSGIPFFKACTIPVLSNNQRSHLLLKPPLILLIVFCFAVIWFPTIRPVSGQIATAVELIRDINTQQVNVSSRSMVTTVGNKIFFVNDSVVGEELWVSDGTLAGTRLVKDIIPGVEGSKPDQLQEVNNTLYFVANDGISGRRVWRSDGTEAGTQLVNGLTLDPKNPSPYIDLLSVGNVILFYYSSTLWKYTDNQVIPVKTGVDSLSRRTVSNGVLYFSNTNQLWRSDGTQEGTVQIATLPNNIDQMVSVQNNIYIFIGDSDRAEVWVSDGTARGTTPVALPTGTTLEKPVALWPSGDTLFFTSKGKVWETNGTPAGTRLLASQPRLPYITVLKIGDVVYFGGSDPQNNSWELWRTDGTPNSTTLLAAVLPSSGRGTINSFINFNGRLAFLANQADVLSVWLSDGTVEGTKPINDTTLTAEDLKLFNNRLVFIGSVNNVRELWSSDGSNAGTVQLSTTSRKTYSSLDTGTEIVPFQGKLYTLASFNGSGLWQTDGTANGTTLVKSFPYIPGPYGGTSSLYRLAATTNRLFFVENLRYGGPVRFWASDGTVEGTIPLGTTKEAPNVPVTFDVLNDKLVTFVQTTVSEPRLFELWTSDGTPAGTVNHGVVPNITDTLLVSKTPLNGKLFFTTGESTVQLWQTDGTVSGTSPIATLSNSVYFVTPPIVVSGKVFIIVTTTTEYQLWVSDGTEAGTKVVTTLPVNTEPPMPSASSDFLAVGNTIFFAIGDSVHGKELWTSDGTAAGTRLVKDINPGSESSSMSYAADVYGTLLFSANDGVHGAELWSSDGTAEGTHLVADIAPGVLESAPSSFQPANGVVFSADDGVTGRELHKIAASVAPNVQIDVPAIVGGAAQSSIAIPLSYSNVSTTKAVSITLSVTLGAGLTYMSDTSSISPTITGNTLTWALPDTTFLVQRSFQLRVATPDQPLGTRIPVDMQVQAQSSEVTTARSEVMIAQQTFLPFIQR